MLDFSKPVFVLAPMADFTDLPFRQVVKKFGADLTISEMVNANSLVYKSQRSFQMIKKGNNENPYFVQLAGHNLKVIREAVEILNDIEGIEGIDINCGCPAPKVVINDNGSALLKNPEKIIPIVQTVKKYSNKKYTSVKTRLGFNKKQPRLIAQTIEKAGADFMSIHGRTRSGRYKATVDYEAIKMAKDSVKIPVIANGDIKSAQDAKKVLDFTACDGVMIGRAAVGCPWIFWEMKNQNYSPTSDLRKAVVLEHFNAMCDFYGQYGVPKFRKILHKYSKDYEGAAHFRDSINRESDIKATQKLIENFF